MPLDCSWPRIWLGSLPSTRLSTAEDALGWMNFVVSLAPMEKLCQLRMALALLVIVWVLPTVLMVAVP